MTVLELKDAVDKAIAAGWGDLRLVVMVKSKNHPSGCVPVELSEAQVNDFGGWGNMIFGTSASVDLKIDGEKNERTKVRRSKKTV